MQLDQQRLTLNSHTYYCPQQVALEKCASGISRICTGLLNQLKADARLAAKQALSADGPTELTPQASPPRPLPPPPTQQHVICSMKSYLAVNLHSQTVSTELLSRVFRTCATAQCSLLHCKRRLQGIV